MVVVMVVGVWRCDDGGEKGEEDREEQGWLAHLGGRCWLFCKRVFRLGVGKIIRRERD